MTDRELLAEACALLRAVDGADENEPLGRLWGDIRAFLARVDAQDRGPATSAVTPDLSLLRALTGEGGRRMGALRRAGYLTWQVTPAGYRALGLPATAVVAEHIDSVYGAAPEPVPNPGPPMSREDFRVASERISPTPRSKEET